MGTPENKIPYSPTISLVESYVGLYKIYTLINPITDEVFYVGQTMMPLETRLSGHISETGANRDKINYIKEIIKIGQRPIIKPIETIPTTCYIDTMAVNEREIYWIKYYKSLGCNLLNKASTSPHTKCNEYHGYLSALKRGETSWHYYYCGKTAGGYRVYDEEKIKADGFLLPKNKVEVPAEREYVVRYNPFECNNFRVKNGLPEIKGSDNKVTTSVFPEQPLWTVNFAKNIPPYKSLKVEMFLEMQTDDCDDEDFIEIENGDYEPDSDDEPDHEDYDSSKFFLSNLEYPEWYYVSKWGFPIATERQRYGV